MPGLGSDPLRGAGLPRRLTHPDPIRMPHFHADFVYASIADALRGHRLPDRHADPIHFIGIAHTLSDRLPGLHRNPNACRHPSGNLQSHWLSRPHPHLDPFCFCRLADSLPDWLS